MGCSAPGISFAHSLWLMTVCTVTVCCYADRMPVETLLGVLGEAAYAPPWMAKLFREQKGLWKMLPNTQSNTRLRVSIITGLEAVGILHREMEYYHPSRVPGFLLSSVMVLLTSFPLCFLSVSVRFKRTAIPSRGGKYLYFDKIPPQRWFLNFLLPKELISHHFWKLQWLLVAKESSSKSFAFKPLFICLWPSVSG